MLRALEEYGGSCILPCHDCDRKDVGDKLEKFAEEYNYDR